MSKRVIGIDQSLTNTAWVIMGDGTEIVEGVIRTSKEQTLMERCHIIAGEIGCQLEKYDYPSISIEGLSYGSIGNATRNLAVLFGAIQYEASLSRYDQESWLETPATSLKKFATGNGKADKKMMLEAIPQEYKDYLKANYKASGKNSGLYDIADAYHLARKGLEEIK